MKSTSPKQRLHRAWCMFDWANSGYNLVITATIFPIYFIAVTGDRDDSTPDYISFLGFEAINSAMLNYALAAAYLIVALLSPILSSIADYRGTKKRFMKIFTWMGGLACCGMFFFDAAHIELALVLAALAAIGYTGGIVFNNAYLPEIATPDEQDRLSARGYTFGYIGSVLLQLICFVFVSIQFDDPTFAARLSFLLVGIWWLTFAQIPFRHLPNGAPLRTGAQHSIIYNGFVELRDVYIQLKRLPLIKIYLLAFFFYSMGVQTVMLAAAEFAVKEIRKDVGGIKTPLNEAELITIVLIIQLVAIVGALLMARLSDRIGNLRVLMLTVLLWIVICVIAYMVHSDVEFYMLAAIVGLVMGGIQAMSRSTFAKMMPDIPDTASYFSFYNVAEKVAITIGLFSFGLIEQVTGSMRNSIFALGGFFIIGLLFLIWTERIRTKSGLTHHLLPEA